MMICSNCGREVPEGDKFCSMCGWKVPVPEEPKPEQAKEAGEKAEEASAPEEPKPEQAKEAGEKAEEASAPEEPKAERAKEAGEKAEEAAAPEEPKPGEIKATEEVKPAPASPTNPPEPEKKKRNKKIPIMIGAAAVLLVILLAANWAALTNVMMRTFSTPEKYYQWVEKNTVQDAAASVASIYSSYLLETLKLYDTGSSGEITIKLDEAGQDMLSLAGLAGVDLSWFESATVTYEGYSRDNRMQSLLGFCLGKDELLSLDVIWDLEEEITYLAIPELSKKYLGVEAADYSYYLRSTGYSAEYMELLETVCKELPEDRQVQKLFSKYLDIALACIDDVDIKKGKTLRAEGISQTCTELVVTIDADTVEDMLEAVFEEAEGDKEIEEIIVGLFDKIAGLGLDDFEDIDGEEVYEEFQESCRTASRNAKYAVASDFELVMTLYVDGKGNVRGRTIAYDNGWDSVEMEISVPHKGNKFGYKASVSVDNETIAVEGSGKDLRGKVTGDFTLKYNGAGIIDVAVKKFDTKALKKGYLNGSFTVKASSGISRAIGMVSVSSILGDMELTLDMSMDDTSARCVVNLAEGDESWGSIIAQANRKSGKKVSVPSGKNTIFIEDEEDFEDYWDSISWSSFLKKLDKSDLPSGVVDYVEEFTEMDAEELLRELDYLLWDLMYYMY